MPAGRLCARPLTSAFQSCGRIPSKTPITYLAYFIDLFQVFIAHDRILSLLAYHLLLLSTCMLKVLSLLVFFLLPLSMVSILHAQIYTNGPVSTGATSSDGIAAPAGYAWSEGLANAALGFSATNGINTLADNFTVPAGQTWTLTGAAFFPYQPGYSGTTSPLTELYVRIWKGAPNEVGSTLVFGDLTTNRLVSGSDAQVYRIVQDAVGTTRHVWRAEATIAPALTLDPGTYWVEWSSTAGSNHFYAPITLPGQAQVAGADALQSSFDSWAALTDAGMGVTVDFPFQLLSNTPLPVTLVAFSAQALKRDAVQLQWTTASELHSARFVVERSRDGQEFTAIGSVEAAGTTSTHRTYSLLDTQLPPSGTTVYYRLRQVDQNGTSAYSPVRSVALTLAPAVLATFPNPATRATTLTGATAGAPIYVVDALGRTVTTATADATGTAELPLPAGLASGVYVVRAGGQALRLLVK
jgi:hypothetical protein